MARRCGFSLFEVLVVMGIILSMSSVMVLGFVLISHAPIVKEKSAIRVANEMEMWLKKRIKEGCLFGESFTLHLAGAYSDHITLTWSDTGKKERFFTNGDAYLINYAYKREDVYLMPKWVRMSKGFTIKFNITGKSNEAGIRFLIVSPYARVRLSDTPP